MLAQIELTKDRSEALTQLEKLTGENRSTLIGRALDAFLEQQREYVELSNEIEQARNEIASGICHSSAEVMANAMVAISKVKSRKSAE